MVRASGGGVRSSLRSVPYRSLKILIVDEHAASSTVMRHSLSSRGHTCEVAQTADERHEVDATGRADYRRTRGSMTAVPTIGLKVFSATKHVDRERLGDIVTDWIRLHPDYQVFDKIVTQSSDAEFHCLAITLFYRVRSPADESLAPRRTVSSKQS